MGIFDDLAPTFAGLSGDAITLPVVGDVDCIFVRNYAFQSYVDSDVEDITFAAHITRKSALDSSIEQEDVVTHESVNYIVRQIIEDDFSMVTLILDES